MFFFIVYYPLKPNILSKKNTFNQLYYIPCIGYRWLFEPSSGIPKPPLLSVKKQKGVLNSVTFNRRHCDKPLALINGKVAREYPIAIFAKILTEVCFFEKSNQTIHQKPVFMVKAQMDLNFR